MPHDAFTEVIYALCDSQGRVRYIGRTYKPLPFRLAQARNPRPSDRRPIAEWMRENRATVTIRKLEVVGWDRRDRSSRERRWIKRLSARGIPLLNRMHIPSGA